MPVIHAPRPNSSIMSASRPRTPPPPPQTRQVASGTAGSSSGGPPPGPPPLHATQSSSTLRPSPTASQQRAMSYNQDRRRPEREDSQRQGQRESSSLFSGLLSGSRFAAKARSSVDYIATNAKPVRSALQNASSYIASTAGLSDNVPESSDKEKTWGEWAREWTDRRSQEVKGTEQLNIMPGWCVRVERPGVEPIDGIAPFDLHISTSGFCTYLRSPEYATRSQKMFMRIAKGFAALPRLPEIPGKLLHEEPLSSSPRSSDLDLPGTSPNATAGGPQLPLRRTDNGSVTPSRQSSTDSTFANLTEAQLRAFHANLDARLQPFWSSVLQRRISLAVYTIPLPPSHHHRHRRTHKHTEPELPTEEDEPLLRSTLSTNAQGQFSQKLVVPWERICSHPPSLKLAFSPSPPITGPVPKRTEHEAHSADSDAWGLYIRAELLTERAPDRLPPSASSLQPGVPPRFSSPTATEPAQLLPPEPPSREEGANAFFSPAALPVAAGSGDAQQGGLKAVGRTAVHSSVVTPIAGSEGVRVISDLDDTVKTSDILFGARQVFRNVFCKAVDEMAVQGMADLYCRLAQEGVAGYHYVSNSPSNLWPVLSQFFNHHPFPGGFSIKLKYYGGGNLINGLFEPAGDRKRPGIVEVLDSFPRAKFILIGDSGEQDLELYVAIARERPQQVLAILIRDVTSAFAAKRRINDPRATAGDGGPKAPPSSSTVDLHALSDALDEAPSVTSAADSEEQPGSGQPKSALSRAHSWDTARMNAMTRLAADRSGGDGRATRPIGQSSRQASSSAGSSPPVASPAATEDGGFNDLIEDVGAEGPASEPTMISTDEMAEAEHDIQVLTATQIKLQRRAEEWVTRMVGAKRALPHDFPLLFFQNPPEIEEVIAEKVRNTVTNWRRET